MSRIFQSAADVINREGGVSQVPMSALRGHRARSAVKFLTKENEGGARSEIRQSSPGLELLARVLNLDLNSDETQLQEQVVSSVASKVTIVSSRAQHILPCCAFFFTCFLLLCLALAIGSPWYRTSSDFEENGAGDKDFVHDQWFYFSGIDIDDDFHSWDDFRNADSLEQLYTIILWCLVVGLILLILSIPCTMLLCIPFESILIRLRDRLVYKFILVGRVILAIMVLFTCLLAFFLVAAAFLSFFDHPDRVNEVTGLGCAGTNDKWCSVWMGSETDENEHIDADYAWGPTYGWAFAFIFLYCIIFLGVCMVITLVGDVTTALTLQLDPEGASQDKMIEYLVGAEEEFSSSESSTSSTKNSSDEETYSSTEDK